MVDRARTSIGGAFLGAVLASSCCLGPLLLSALGIGGLGVFGWVGGLRPYLLGVTAAMLASAFYLTYRRPKPAAYEACGCPPSRSRRFPKIALWESTGLVVLLSLAPSLVARVTEHGAAPLSSTARIAVVHVEGMDCEACAAPMRKALAKVGGFQRLDLDLKKQTVSIAYELGPGRPDAYVQAIDRLGYEARLLPSNAGGAP
jgi:mercuric ion transport protein